MKNYNTKSQAEYILDNIISPLTYLPIYWALYFAALPGLSRSRSRLILWLMLLAFVLVGYFLTFQKRRNSISVAVNSLLPYELYTILAYRSYIPRLILCAVIPAGLLAAAYLALVMTLGRKPPQKPLKFMRRLKYGLLGARTIVTLCLLIMLVPLGVRLLFHHGLMLPSVPSAASAAEASEWTVANNIDTVRLLQEEEWSRLSPQEKLDVLGVVVNIETRYLGLNHELYLRGSAPDGNTLANYNPKTCVIEINIDHLESASAADVLNSICHECYHSYQHEMVELYQKAPKEYRNMLLFYGVEDYIREFSDYADGEKDLQAYYRQSVEADARSYAVLAVLDYYQRIEECLAAAA